MLTMTRIRLKRLSFLGPALAAGLIAAAGCSDNATNDRMTGRGSAETTSEQPVMADASQSDKSSEGYPVQKSEQEWRQKLTADEFYILRQAGTEKPFTGQYVKEKTPGVYTCAGCGNALFDSQTKFESGTGWPSFYDVIDKANVELRKDTSAGMVRTEVLCGRCGGHLGHVFDDATDQPTGKRYCINSAALELDPRENDSE
jgi:peptide-methionine (R)-S-oxide reductase